MFTVTHIISAIAGIGGALVSDVFFTFYSHDKKFSNRELNVLNTLSTVVWVSLVVIIVSGIGIFLSDPVMYSASAKFLAKMSIVLILSINGYLLHHLVKPHLAHRRFLDSPKERRPRMVAFSCGAVSLVSWLSVLALALIKNTPFSYGEIMPLFILVLIFTITAALVVERRLNA
ncbi:hypothetical protein IT398_01865 [Candidatus Nomurabacteria bacterium]|nr:hypothetical protein [Candidatus Nomurabacteria bacterium]